MQLKHKIVALSVLPLLLAVAVVCVLVFFQNQRLGEQQARLIEDSILASKRVELKHYVEMALSIISPLYESGRDDAEIKQQVLGVLARISFGSDGYFFVYESNGRNLMHPRQGELVGQDLWNMTDPRGLLVIQALMQSAQSGDGFQLYAWQKPSSGEVTDKLAYVVMLERWGWMLGTGIYLEDVDQAIAQVHDEASNGIHATMLAIAGVALVAVLLVFAGGLALNLREHRLADRKLQLLTQRIVSLQEEERSRVSRELHDGISQLLASSSSWPASSWPRAMSRVWTRCTRVPSGSRVPSAKCGGFPTTCTPRCSTLSACPPRLLSWSPNSSNAAAC